MDVWKQLLVRDFDVPIDLQNQFTFSPLHLYISFARSRISPLGIFKPNMKPKETRKDPSNVEFVSRNLIEPFYVLHLYHKSSRTRRIEAKYSKDASSYYKRVLEVCEVFILDIQGKGLVRFPGYYRVTWRLKISHDYFDLNELTFLTSVDNGEKFDPVRLYEKPVPEEGLRNIFTYIIPNQPQPIPRPLDEQVIQPIVQHVEEPLLFINPPGLGEVPVLPPPPPLQQIPPVHITETWFDVDVGYIHIKEPGTNVFLTLLSMNPAWKYGLWIDYVSIVPVLEKEYLEGNLGFRGDMNIEP